MLRKGMLGAQNPVFITLLEHPFFISERIQRIIQAKGLSAAIDYFQKAIAQDPTYAPAYAGLADCYAVMVTHSSARPSDVFPKAIAAATKALEFDETLADPHASLAYTKDVYEWDWAGAEREYKRALQLNPNDASTYHWHALH